MSRLLGKLPPIHRFSEENKTDLKITEEEEEKAKEAIGKNVGLAKFLTRPYNTTALAIIATLSSSYIGWTLPSFCFSSRFHNARWICLLNGWVNLCSLHEAKNNNRI